MSRQPAIGWAMESAGVPVVVVVTGDGEVLLRDVSGRESSNWQLWGDEPFPDQFAVFLTEGYEARGFVLTGGPTEAEVDTVTRLNLGMLTDAELEQAMSPLLSAIEFDMKARLPHMGPVTSGPRSSDLGPW